MASGVEVMICHAENLSRHLERAREDLNELRVKERLEADETSTPSPLANGSTSYGKTPCCCVTGKQWRLQLHYWVDAMSLSASIT